MTKLALSLAFAVISAVPSAAQVWTQVPLPVAPPTNSISSRYVMDPTDAGHLLTVSGDLQTWYETFDGGASWGVLQEPALPPGVVRSGFSVDSQGNLICTLARTGQAIPLAGPVAMVRQGGAWQAIGPSLAPNSSQNVQGGRVVRGTLDPDLLVLDAVYPDSFGGRWLMYISTDDGATWGPELMGGGVETIVESVAGPYLVGSLFSSNPYPTVSIFRSAGLDALDQYLFGGTLVDFDFSTKFPSSMLAISSDDDLNQGEQRFSRSLDGGANWSQLELLVGDRQAGGLAVHPSRPDCAVLLRATQNMELTVDGGLTFEPLGVPYRPLGFVEDGRVLFAADGTGLYRAELFPSVGSQECSAQVNGSGQAASIAALGSASVAENGLAIAATDVAPNQFGFFVVSPSAGFTPNPGGSYGDLCLSGAIGRYSGLLQNAGPYGQLYGDVDLTGIPSPNGAAAGQAGQTWRFQAWFRDTQGGVAGSNFSDAVAVTLLP